MNNKHGIIYPELAVFKNKDKYIIINRNNNENLIISSNQYKTLIKLVNE